MSDIKDLLDLLARQLNVPPSLNCILDEIEVLQAARAQAEQPSAGAEPEPWSEAIEAVRSRLNDGGEGWAQKQKIEIGNLVLDDLVGEIEDMLTAAPTAQAVQGGGVPDYVWEALQRLIENGGQCGPASREDALVVAKHRHALLTHPHNGEQGGEWPAMPDKFYEGLGWMHAECCAALDRGEDPRAFEVGDMVKRCIHDLTRPQPPKSKEDES